MENNLQNASAQTGNALFQKTENQNITTLRDPNEPPTRPTAANASSDTFAVAGLGAWPDLWYFPAYAN
ncbi:MAG: hypothetical protein U0U46_06375 [Saprospiraceae bacterium]